MRAGLTKHAISAPAGGETIDVFNLFSILRRRIRLILVLALLGLLGGLVAGKQITPTYTARSLVVVDPQQNAILGAESAVQPLATDEVALQTQLEFIRSPKMVARVMDELELFNDPEFNPALREDEGGLMTAALDIARALPSQLLIAAGFAESPEPPALSDYASALTARTKAIQAFRRRMLVANDGGSYVISIGFTSYDREKAALIANETAEAYIAAQLEAKQQTSVGTRDWLDARIDELREEVNTAERAVEQFRAENDLVGVNGASLSEAQVGDINKELVVARANLAGLQARLRLIQDVRRRGDLTALGEVLSSPVIISLRQREAELLREEGEAALTYGDRHPRRQQLLSERQNIIRAISEEVQRTVTALENEAQAAAIRVESMESELDQVKGVNSRNLEAEVRLRELERNAAVARQLYETLLQRLREVAAREQNIRPDIRVMAAADPPTAPSSPGPRLLALAGFVMMGAVGSMLALLLERADKGLRSVSEVRQLLELPVLALVPQLRGIRPYKKPHRYLAARPMSVYGEAIRAAHTVLRDNRSGQVPPRVIFVTSALPSEGKTTLAISLAVFAARMRQRTLLVDLDLRHPMVARELGHPVVALGPEVDLQHGAILDSAFRDRELGIDVLSIDSRRYDPAALAAQNGPLEQLLLSARDHYDLVVIDSAPVIGVSETTVLARLADKVVFALRWNDTPAEAATDAVRTLREAGADLAGAVITLVDLKRHAAYGYHDVGEYYNSSKYARYYAK